VLYLDKQLVKKSKKLGLNLSKTFENHLKHLVNGYSPISIQNKLI
jgi:post-segregation antitoxin (ccd killing protein)